MFRRREKKSLKTVLSNLVWPNIGWSRTYYYWAHRVSRLPGSVYSIAGGFACGAAVSFTPFVGLHFILGGILAWVMRANLIASAIGTAVGNPWTFPFIWFWIYKLGVWLGFGSNDFTENKLDFASLFGATAEAILKLNISYLVDTTWPILKPMLIGSLPTGFCMWFAFYFLLKYIINLYRGSRIERSAQK